MVHRLGKRSQHFFSLTEKHLFDCIFSPKMLLACNIYSFIRTVFVTHVVGFKALFYKEEKVGELGYGGKEALPFIPKQIFSEGKCCGAD